MGARSNRLGSGIAVRRNMFGSSMVAKFKGFKIFSIFLVFCFTFFKNNIDLLRSVSQYTSYEKKIKIIKENV